MESSKGQEHLQFFCSPNMAVFLNEVFRYREKCSTHILIIFCPKNSSEEIIDLGVYGER